MKKTKLPGDNISLKTKKNESELVMAWLNAQSNLMDSIRYLVENEISTNGVRNLQTCIPVERGVLQHSRPERLESTASRESTLAGQSAAEGAGAATGEGPSASGQLAAAEVIAASAQLAAAEELPASSPLTAAEEEEEVDEEDVEAWS